MRFKLLNQILTFRIAPEIPHMTSTPDVLVEALASIELNGICMDPGASCSIGRHIRLMFPADPFLFIRKTHYERMHLAVIVHDF